MLVKWTLSTMVRSSDVVDKRRCSKDELQKVYNMHSRYNSLSDCLVVVVAVAFIECSSPSFMESLQLSFILLKAFFECFDIPFTSFDFIISRNLVLLLCEFSWCSRQNIFLCRRLFEGANLPDLVSCFSLALVVHNRRL